MADFGNGNGRLWRWKKIDILFVVGVGVIVYGAVIVHVEIIIAGAGIAGIPLAQRGDRNL